MTNAQIAALPIGALAEKDAHLYLWTTNSHLPIAFSIAKAWGFTYSILLPWCKAPRGFAGFPTYSIATEYLLFCRRGTLKPLRRWPRNWFTYKRGAHSAKPPEFAAMIEEVSPGPRCELFARGPARPGWATWGDETTSDAGLSAVMDRVLESAAWAQLGSPTGRPRTRSAT